MPIATIAISASPKCDFTRSVLILIHSARHLGISIDLTALMGTAPIRGLSVYSHRPIGTMRYRVLIVGIDVDLLAIRQVLLNSWGYDSLIATPWDVDEQLRSGRFDLVILSLTLSQEEKVRIQAKIPPGTRTLLLKTFVWPEDLRHTVAEALG